MQLCHPASRGVPSLQGLRSSTQDGTLFLIENTTLFAI